MRTLYRVILWRRVHVEGLNNVPTSGAVLIIGNHIATLDPPLTGALLRRSDVFYMAKAESFRNRWSRLILTGYNAFPVARGRADRSAMRRAIAILDGGHVLLVYPEGSRSPDAQLRRPHTGAGFLARHSDATVVPVAIWGSEHVLPKGARWPRRNHVYVKFGVAARIGEIDSGTAPCSHQELADAMMWRVADLLPGAYRGVFVSPERVAAAAPPAA